MQEESTSTLPPEDEEIGSVTMLPPYIPSMLDDAPKVRISKNARFPLVPPSIPKGVWVTRNILPNLKKMTFIVHGYENFHSPSSDEMGKRIGERRFTVIDVHVTFWSQYRGECMC